MSSSIAYLINQYPKVSHSFIRREIAGVEAGGMKVLRFAIRSRADELVDEADQQELEKTRVILSVGIAGLFLSSVQVALTRLVPFLQALKLTIRIGLNSERGLLLHLVYLMEACVFLRWLSPTQVTHVHSHFGTNSTTVAMLCHALGGPPYSFTVHGPEEFDKVQAIALPEKIRRAAFVIAISAFGQSQLYRWCDRESWSKIHIVHCGVDQTFLEQPLVPIPQAPRLVCVGRLCPEKGQLLLIEAARQLAEEGMKFELILVGDGPLRPELETLILRWNLQDFIKITGWASASMVRQHILDARSLVLPSFAEGLPVVIMEALALGRPVISTYIAGIPELVRPEVCGWLIPAGSITDLVAAMRTVLQLSHEVLEHKGKAGMVAVRESYNVAIETQKIVQMFQSDFRNRSSSIEAKTLKESLPA